MPVDGRRGDALDPLRVTRTWPWPMTRKGRKQMVEWIDEQHRMGFESPSYCISTSGELTVTLLREWRSVSE